LGLQDRSKNHFINANLAQTGAQIDESIDLSAIDRKRIIIEIGRPRGKICCSLGCGIGRFLRSYSEHSAATVVGLDINRGNLQRCKKIDSFLVLGDVENLPFKIGAFHIIDCEATMEHIANPQKAVKEIDRVTNDAGFSFVTFHVYRWIEALEKQKIRLRLFLMIRDFILDATRLGYFAKNVEKGPLRILFFDYRTYRNKGYSYPEIKRIYDQARTKVVLMRVYSHVVFVVGKKQMVGINV
jgi:ubiquinone/menaquinone biosynthesis C-methylase UbiE